MTARVFAAVDIGASGGRVMAGTVDGDRLALDPVHRFANGATARDGHLRWNVTELYRQIQVGLLRLPEVASIGIDTWAVDYGLLDDGGRLLAEPISYRDDRTTKIVDEVHAVVPFEELYAVNGLQFLPFTTMYQLAAEQRGSLWDRAARAVLLPDLIAYWLTGALRTEVTNASTTGFLDARSRLWSRPLFEHLGVPPDLLPPVETPGAVRGHTSTGVPVIAVGSHDTASAVVGIPATNRRFAYVVCGTWSLVGLELDAPVLTPAARQANFTNEAGVDGRTRFLRNVGGLWLLQECLRAWGHDNLDLLLAQAESLPAGGPTIDVDDAAFIPPGGMPQRIAAAAGGELSTAGTVRCVLDSLAAAFARTVWQAADLAGVAVDVIHVVGGGSQNELLCRLVAQASGLPVVAGPAEATALGNVVVQARAAGALPASLDEIRARIARATACRRYDPS